jgi:hypothetical protein
MGFFDFNNPQHRQIADAFGSGNFNQLDPQQVASSYQGFVDRGPEEEVQQVHQEYFNQMPKVEQMGLFNSLVNAVQQNGIDPHQAGVSTTDPRQASPLDLGNLFNLARNSGLLGGMFGGGQSQTQSGLGGMLGGGGQSQSGLGGALGGMLGGALGGNQGSQQQPVNGNNQEQGGLGGLLSNPIAQAALGGLVSFAASRAFGGNNNNNQSEQNLPGSSNFGQSDFQNNNLPPTSQSDFRM